MSKKSIPSNILEFNIDNSKPKSSTLKKENPVSNQFNLKSSSFTSDARTTNASELFKFNPENTLKYDILPLPSTDKSGNYHLGQPIAPGTIPFRKVNPTKSIISPSNKNTVIMENLLSTLKVDEELKNEDDDLLYKTGEEAISFFARYGVSTPTKFVHCKLRIVDELKDFRPYDLIVVPHKESSNDYYTISSSGVVHIQPDEPSEFISLSEWMRQSTLFNMLTSIRYFKLYLATKLFRSWRSHIRYNLYCHQRLKLSKTLFFSKTSFAGPLLAINRHLYEMQAIRLTSIKQQTTTLADFVKDQNDRRNDASNKFQEVFEKLQLIVEKVVVDVKERARSDLLEDENFNARANKSKSIVSLKEEVAERAKRLQRAAMEESLLADLIRLVDYMVVENLVLIAAYTNVEVLEALQQPRKQGLFLTSISFGNDGMQFAPTDTDIYQATSKIMEGMIAIVSSVPRILFLKTFQPVLVPSGGSIEGPRVDWNIKHSSLFLNAKSQIELRIEEDYREAKIQAQTFDSYQQVFHFVTNWDSETYIASDPSVDQLKADLNQINRWYNDVEKNMRSGFSSGVFHIESRRLKQALTPKLEAALIQSKDLLLKSFSRRCTELVSQYNERRKTFSTIPEQLKAFAGYVEKVKAVKLDRIDMENRAQQIELMASMLRQYEVRIPPTDSVQLENLREARKDFDTIIFQTDAQVGEKMPTMRESVDKNIYRINGDLTQIRDSLLIAPFNDENKLPTEILFELEKINTKLETLKDQIATVQNWQVLFDMDAYQFNSLTTSQNEFENKHRFWSMYEEWINKAQEWEDSEFSSLDMDNVSKIVNQYFKEAYSFAKASNDELTLKVKRTIENWRGMLPVLNELGNQAMKRQHWTNLFESFKKNKNVHIVAPHNGRISIAYLVSAGAFLSENRTVVSDVVAQAVNEFQLLSTLHTIKKSWERTEFKLQTYREYKDVWVMTEVDEILTQLDENQITLQTMLGSRYAAPIKDEVDVWDRKLGHLSEVLDEWLTCQRNWMYLETIFSAPDIQKQMPSESKRFMDVDRSWREIMKRVHRNSNVIAASEFPDILKQFIHNNKELDRIQKELEEYLEMKRSNFPRFYFLSNDELLAILSKTREPSAVQPHLRKCFDSISSLEFSDVENTQVSAMVSGENEIVPFTEIVVTRGNVEDWLNSIEMMMQYTIKSLTFDALSSYPKDLSRAEWLFQFPSQPILTVDQIMWTNGAMNAILALGSNKQALVEFLENCKKQIEEMVDLVRTDLKPIQRATLTSLIVLDVHSRDVLQKMIENNVNSLNDFEWTKQLRYYWENDEQKDLNPNFDFDTSNTYIRQTNTRFCYGYEYLGCTSRLVITPLTDQCFLTLTGALHLKFGGAPSGPAGTGKTETVKDLAKSLGIQIVVFNCSDGLTYSMMGRFFSGLAQAGAWACFDEFNRIDIEVLSVIAQQILTIQTAIVANKESVDFMGRLIPLTRARFGVFITMNPGYAGRTELPDNLKALFRPVAMMIPDYALIAQIILFSEGFKTASVLSKKMVQLYKLSSEQLSKQDHYDFGMRAVKSVLVMAGQLKRADPNLEENLLLIRAMRDSNVPKFLEHDLPLFYGIIADLFPGVDVPYIDYGKLKLAIDNQLNTNGLQQVNRFSTKIIQLHETMIVRHGVMLVGSTMSGKSVCADILAKSLTQLHAECPGEHHFYQKVEKFVLNPKAITMGELYGEVNPSTKEWHDGLVAKLVRDACEDTRGGRKWIVFDGPVDALWIENMNTVLDDNKTLCLASAERIKLSNNITMCFEVEDLAVASPATVSRCGMVYLEPIHLGWEPLLKSWTPKFAESLNLDHDTVEENSRSSISSLVSSWLLTYAPSILTFIREKCAEKISSVDNNLVASFLKLIQSLCSKEIYTVDSLNKLLPYYFIFALVWSFGANVDDDSRVKFSDFFKDKLSDFISLPAGNIYDYVVDVRTSSFQHWNSIMGTYTYDAATPYFNILVPTVDTTLLNYLVHTLFHVNSNVLVSGDTGVGKSVILTDFFARSVESILNIPVSFSAQTLSNNLQDALESKLEKKRKNLYGPPAGKKMVVFVDDLNMPQPEIYGAQPPLELLRQCLDSEGFYDRKKHTLNKIKDVLFVGACGPPGGGRNPMTSRLVRHYHMIWQPNLSGESMKKIFNSILSGFLSFSNELKPLSSSIVDSSVAMYELISKEMLPMPSRSHYTFNLRDLSKVIQGMLQINKEHLPHRDSLVRLWLHESSRVFRDRLIDEKDRDWFDRACESSIQNFGVDWKSDDFKGNLFGDYLSTGDNKPYKFCPEFNSVQHMMESHLAEYNELVGKMDLVLFRDAINHLSRLCRILRQPRGNALLVGVGGSGRQSLTRLAAFIVGQYKTISIEITRGYGVEAWHEDIKKMLMAAGTSPIVFLLSDSQIVHESFLEDVNNLLNSGEIPNLFESEDIDNIVNTIRPLCKAAGKIDSRDNVLAHFVQLVRENLHIVLAFSPVGDLFRTRCRRFPSLVNCCTIDWYNAWPNDALYSVAQHFLSNPDLGVSTVQKDLCSMCVTIHSSVSKISGRFYDELRRHNYTTPTSYLELINVFISILVSQRNDIHSRSKRYSNGFLKLLETNKVVEQLKIDLINLQPTLEQSSKDTAALLIELEKDQAEANIQQNLCAADAAECESQTVKVKAFKDDCQKDLDLAMPAFEEAIRSLDTLQKDHIGEMKRFANPPALVATCMEAVCILFGRKPGWSEAQKLLGEADFLYQCKDFKKDEISGSVIKKIRDYVQKPEFTAEKMASVSTAGTSLIKWVHAMYIYATVAKEIGPKKAALEESENQLRGSQAVLASKQQSLRVVEERLAILVAKYDASVAKKQQLQTDMERTKAQLVRAEKLVSGLSEEGKRWQSTAASLEKDLLNVVGNMIMAAGSIAYLGPFTSVYRTELVSEWLEFAIKNRIPVDPKFDLVRVLGDPVKIRDWAISGLPADQFSTENGLLVNSSRRWPLMIDPQGQANRWIKNLNKKNNLIVAKFSDTFLRTLESAIRYGHPVLLENVDQTLDPSIEPVLLKQVVRKGGQMVLRLGDTDVPYNSDFKLYITTKLPNPHYLPETFVKVSIINFTVTPKGLEDQLLVSLCALERSDLEEKNDKLTVQIATDKKELQNIEDDILDRLNNSKGFILDDEDLINALDASKVKSSQVKERMTDAEKTITLINGVREQYRLVATRGSIIYFVIAELALIDPMYQYSLLYFTNLYTKCIQKSAKSDDLKIRLQILIKDITESVYSNICRGLFEKDKLLFSFMIAANIERNKSISDTLWGVFLRGASTLGAQITNTTLGPDWIKPKIWSNILMLESLPEFKSVVSSLTNEIDAWRNVLELETDIFAKLPQTLITLKPFEKLLLLKTLSEENLVAYIKEYVFYTLGSFFTDIIPFNLEAVYNDSNNVTPIIFVLSAGADPMSNLTKLARAKGLMDVEGQNDKFYSISLGQGQGPFARNLIEMGKKLGGWVCLQNCHLAASWLPELELLVTQIANKDDDMFVHQDFRLWLSSMPSQVFPVPILQAGVKITNEPPKGLKANILRSFNEIDEKEFESCSKPLPYKKILFGIAFFHAAIQERRKYGAIGFNIPYEWMSSDFQVSLLQLKMYLDEQNDIPWQTLFEIIGDVNYGGRVTDDKDQRCVRSILAQYVTPDILKDNYKFSESGKYFAPPEGNLTSFKNYILSLPSYDAPNTFGLHDNADIVFHQKDSSQMLSSVISIQPRVSTMAAKADDMVYDLAESIIKRLPAPLEKDKASFSTFEGGFNNCLGIFLSNEIGRFNKLLKVIKGSLKELQKALKGLVVMSVDLEKMYNKFLYNAVPLQWEKAAYPSLKPLASWFDDFLQRFEFIRSWLMEGPPASFWISGFFFPQGFMTAILQTHSRKNKMAIDSLKFSTSVTTAKISDIKAPATGVYIYGLFLQGAKWSRKNGHLSESRKGEIFAEMPVIYLEPVDINSPVSTDTYSCPVYKTSARAGELSTTGHSTNFVLYLQLKTEKESDHWVRRGCALLTQLDN